jgi:hypothetical protein
MTFIVIVHCGVKGYRGRGDTPPCILNPGDFRGKCGNTNIAARYFIRTLRFVNCVASNVKTCVDTDCKCN